MCKKEEEELRRRSCPFANLSVYKYMVDQCVNVASRATQGEMQY
jgi:hypothetical protein